MIIHKGKKELKIAMIKNEIEVMIGRVLDIEMRGDKVGDRGKVEEMMQEIQDRVMITGTVQVVDLITSLEIGHAKSVTNLNPGRGKVVVVEEVEVGGMVEVEIEEEVVEVKRAIEEEVAEQMSEEEGEEVVTWEGKEVRTGIALLVEKTISRETKSVSSVACPRVEMAMRIMHPWELGNLRLIT